MKDEIELDLVLAFLNINCRGCKLAIRLTLYPTEVPP